MDVRLNKYICESGHCSRREADKFIDNGNVTINGKTAKVTDKVKPNDVVKVNGILIEGKGESVYLVLNKPKGITCTTDLGDPTNIVDFVNYPTRVFNIGRLDKDSEGLILMTDDGDIVNKILRSGNHHEKEYEVTVDKMVTPEFIVKMQSGVPILGMTTKKCKVVKEGDREFRIILTQGLNRQIRRMCEVFGYEVVKLRRVRLMNIRLGKLPLGQWRSLTEEEMEILMGGIRKSKGGEEASKSAGSAKKGSSSSKPKSSGRPSPFGAAAAGGGSSRGGSSRGGSSRGGSSRGGRPSSKSSGKGGGSSFGNRSNKPKSTHSKRSR